MAARIADDIYNGRRRPRDFAVFYRVNALSREFELALRRHGVPFQLIHSVEFFQRKEIKDITALPAFGEQPARRGGVFASD